MKKIVQYKWIIAINVLFLAILFFAIPKYNDYRHQKKILLPAVPEIVSSEPIIDSEYSIIIPKIEVHASVEPVGRTAGGNMAVTKSYSTVGWYKYGAKPGEVGNAVLAGHLDNGYGKAGVFYKLNELEIGDTIIVESKSGERAEFRVSGMQVVDYLSPPQEVLSQVFGTSTRPHLNLITCDGTWIPEKKKYSDRLIVFADRVD